MIKEVLPVTPYLKKEKRFCPLNGANTFLIPLTFLVILVFGFESHPAVCWDYSWQCLEDPLVVPGVELESAAYKGSALPTVLASPLTSGLSV